MNLIKSLFSRNQIFTLKVLLLTVSYIFYVVLHVSTFQRTGGKGGEIILGVPAGFSNTLDFCKVCSKLSQHPA